MSGKWESGEEGVSGSKGTEDHHFPGLSGVFSTKGHTWEFHLVLWEKQLSLQQHPRFW